MDYRPDYQKKCHNFWVFFCSYRYVFRYFARYHFVTIVEMDIFFFPKLFLNSSTEFEIHKSLANSKLFQKKTTFWTFLQILTHCVMYCTSLSQCLWFHSQQNFVDSYEVTTTEATYLSNTAYLFVLSQRKFVERLLNLKI